ncbi:MAG: hypothetical protein IT569_10360 [Leptospiraceae bacterium]|nr:hypothetical protein [Leptospiraceae bacterium]
MLVEIKSISAESLNSEEIAQEVHRTVSSYLIQKTIEEEDNQNKRDQVKRSAATYIQEAINNLEQKASKSSIASMIWFVISAITLMSSTWFIYGLSKDYLPVIANLNKLDSNLIIFISLKSLIIISLCATTSRLTFKLGTVYRAEQLKNLDRIHAISYGKFYLEAFGDQANWVELKEVFQHWNIGNDISTFSLQKSEKSIDIIENLLLEIRAFLSKNLTKK